MSNFPEWAAFAGMADNPTFPVEERLAHALRAIQLLEGVLDEERRHPLRVVLGVNEEASKRWKELIAGLTLLSKGATGSDPTYCSHDVLTVCADPSKFTQDDLDVLNKMGFSPDDTGEAFQSFRFGSA